MGTNYYAKRIQNVCPACGRGDESETIHIGKSSAGWCFGLHVTDALPDLEAWKRYLSLPGIVIKNEYEEILTLASLLDVITNRTWVCPRETRFEGLSERAAFHQRNHSEDGPNGLLRHKVGDHCVGHGIGTWDLIPGEFS